ncbi:MAG: hypothetical protein ACPG19_01860 [Saprospiraceae bacterium]
MQKIYLIVVFTLLCHTSTFARFVQGYFINLTDDTLKVQFDIPISQTNTPDIRSIHFGVHFLDPNDIERELKPHQAKEVCFQYNNEMTRLISHIDHLNLEKKIFKKKKTYVFLKLEVEGNLRLYSFYYTQHVNMDFSYKSKFMIFQKKQGLLYLPKRMGFRKAMMKYLEDCPKVYERLKLKMYGKGDEIEITEDYNEKCVGRA